MTTEERNAYARGYNAGQRNRWPEHRPPMPPEPVVRGLLTAGNRLRDEADLFAATLMPDDPVGIALGNAVDVWNEALAALTRSLLTTPTEDRPNG